MVKIQRLIALNDENGSFQAWKKLFEQSEDNFSGWIQQKLLEEQEKRLDPNYIYTKLAQAENDKAYWEKQLIKSKEHQEAKEQQKQKYMGDNYQEENYFRLLDVTIKQMKMWVDKSNEELLPLAEQYLKIPEAQRTTTKEYLKKVIDNAA